MPNVYEGMTATELGIHSAGVASLVAFGKVFSLIVGGMTFIIVARLLGPNSYGVYILAVGVAGFLGAFGSLSLSQYMNRRIPELIIKKEEKKVSEIIGVALVLMLAISTIITFIGLIFAEPIATLVFHNPNGGFVVDIALTSIIVSMIYGTLYAILVSFGDGKDAALSSVTNNSIQAIVSIGLILLGFGALGAVSGWILGLLCGLIFELFALKLNCKANIVFHNFRMHAKEMLSFSLPITGSSIIGGLLSNFGVLYIGMLFLPGAVGLYGMASKIGVYLDLIIGSIGIVLIPMFSVAMASNAIKKRLEGFYNYSIYFGLLFATPLVIYLAIFSNSIIISVFTSTYYSGSIYMALIGIGILLGLIGSYASSLVISAGMIKKVFEYAVVTGVVELAFMLALTPAMGILGVIISLYFVGGILSDYLYVMLVKNSLGIKVKPKVFRLTFANLVLIGVLLPLAISGIKPTYQLIAGFVAVIFVYPMFLGLTKAIGSKELNLLKGISDKIPLFGTWINAILVYAGLFVRETDGL
ncbi:MAG: oligosaccharide flippase family protein [Candidatus Micrarchaeia archaeon]